MNLVVQIITRSLSIAPPRNRRLLLDRASGIMGWVDRPELGVLHGLAMTDGLPHVIGMAACNNKYELWVRTTQTGQGPFRAGVTS